MVKTIREDYIVEYYDKPEEPKKVEKKPKMTREEAKSKKK